MTGLDLVGEDDDNIDGDTRPESETNIWGVLRLSDSEFARSEELRDADKLSAPCFTASAAFLK